MKGFIRILEAVIASIILLSSLSYFFNIPVGTEWGDALLQTEVNDALAAADKSSTQGFLLAGNKTALQSALRARLPGTLDFSTSVRGIPNAEIFIECVCTAQEVTDLRDALGLDINEALGFKQRNITVRISATSFGKIASDGIDPRTDIIFLFGYEDLTPQRPFLDPFIANGGSVFMLAQLDGASDQTLREVFGLANGASSTSGTASFYDVINQDTVSFRAYDYFRAVHGNISEDFGLFGSERVAADERSVAAAGSVSFAKVNYNITLGRGRAVWMGSYPYTSGSEPAANTDKLLAALVLWASGEDYVMDPVPKNTPSQFSEFGRVGILPGNEPYELRLKVWRIFY